MTFEPSPTARDMADALRAGVSARLRDFEAATPDEDLARLQALGALDAVPAVARPTAWSAVVRGLRRFLRGLLRPWLAAQASFNREVAGTAVAAASAAHAVARRVTALETSMHVLRDRLRALEGGDRHAAAQEPLTLDRETLMRLAVQSRIRRPPARVLVSGSGAIAADLAAFGYDVSEPFDVNSSGPAAEFDALVWVAVDVQAGEGRLMPPAGALGRWLRSGGQAIVAYDVGASLPAAALDGLAVRAMLRAGVDVGGWTVAEVPVDAVPQHAPSEGLTMIVAERAHAPGR